MLISWHRFLFTAGGMHQVRANIREMLEAEHQQRNLRRPEAHEMPPYSSFSYEHVEKRPTLQHSLPVRRRKQQDKNSCWNFPSATLSSRPPWGQTVWAAVGRVWGVRRTHPPASAASRGDAGIPALATWLCSLQPHPPPQPKKRFCINCKKSPARGVILILAISAQTLSYLFQESVRQPWGAAASRVGEFVSFNNMDLMNRLPGTGNHFPRIAAK